MKIKFYIVEIMGGGGGETGAENRPRASRHENYFTEGKESPDFGTQ